MNRFRRVAAAAHAHQGRHARVVPAVDDVLFHQLAQLALAGDDVGQVQAREFELVRHGLLEEAAGGQGFQQPVVERAVVLEFQRADRMRDVFQRVRDRVRVVVHRIDAPGVARAVVMRVADAVDGRIAQVHVRRTHGIFADLRAQDVLAILELARLHGAEQGQRFVARTVAERRILAGLAEIAPVGGHVFGALAVHIGKAGRDQVLGHRIQLVEIVACVVQVALAIGRLRFPVKAQPFHAVHDGVDVFLLFLGRVGVVEAQVALAGVVARQAEVDADRLGVAHVQVAVRLRRETRDHLGQAGTHVGAGSQVGFDDVTQEIGRQRWRGGIRFIVAH